MRRDSIKKALEAILFCAGGVVKLKDLLRVFPETDEGELRDLLLELKEEFSTRGIRVEEVAGGFRMETAPEVAEYVKRFLTPKPRRFSKQVLETLAVVAYKQPVTKNEIEAIRGVDPSGALRVLLEQGLVKVVGRKKVPGRPVLYGTTERFLEVFGLKGLEDLPPIEELERLAGTKLP